MKRGFGFVTTNSSDPMLPSAGSRYWTQLAAPLSSLVSVGGGSSVISPAGTRGGCSLAGRCTTTLLMYLEANGSAWSRSRYFQENCIRAASIAVHWVLFIQ